ncbi:pyridoxal 5'-phosphate synthase glutaminase subunit PdxT [Candidatus Peregrinibacteria bacterium]|nr:MAG: pyridoxal 5'-phosphate synthase glutaminase subunit PdxT [Candidatus Peregrinibacteria bacterium]
MKEKKIGVLALQGGVREHLFALSRCGTGVCEVRVPNDLVGLCGIILPGGESTTMGKLLEKNNLQKPLQEALKQGLPVWGTCAGAILLSKSGSEYSLGILDADVDRNAYGSQISSQIAPVSIRGIVGRFPAVFIRAPRFSRIGSNTEILSEWNNEPIFLRQKTVWATSFHPELTDDIRVHKAFMEMCFS